MPAWRRPTTCRRRSSCAAAGSLRISTCFMPPSWGVPTRLQDLSSRINKWVPSFARGQVRDLRPRWVLEEVGLPYEVRLLDHEDQQGAAYRAQQPFGQVPVLEMD